MLLYWTSLAVILSVVLAEPAARDDKSRQPTWSNKLKHDLLPGYDKAARPFKFSGYVNVNFTLSVSHIVVDEPKSMVVIKAWSYIEWVDDHLRWNASEYGGLTKISLPDQTIWHPDVFLLNSAVGEHKDNYLDSLCTVYNNGSVYWAPSSQFSTYCELDLRRWPYDKQVCHFYFSSWIEDAAHIVLTSRKRTPLEEHGILEPCDWGLLHIKERMLTNEFPWCNEESNIIGVTVSMFRLTSGYGTVVFPPALVCAMLTLAMFWVPPLSQEKFLIPGVNLVITTILLVYFSQFLLIKTHHTPFIVVFYATNLVLVCISMMVSISLWRGITARPIHSAVNRLLSSPVSAYLRLDHVKDSFISLHRQHECKDMQGGILETEEPNTQQNTCSGINESILFLTVIDRVMFILYLLIFCLMGLAFYII